MTVTRVSFINPYVTLFASLCVLEFSAAAVPEQHVRAHEGGCTFLNCHLDNQDSVENLTVEYSKDGKTNIVHLLKHRRDQVEDQMEEFRGRTRLDHEGLKRGNVTLELLSVCPSDSGKYRCFIPKRNHYCYIILTVVPKRQNITTNEKDSRTDEPQAEDESEPGDSGGKKTNVVLAVILPIIVCISMVVFGIYIRFKPACRWMQRLRRRQDEEMPELENLRNQETGQDEDLITRMSENQPAEDVEMVRELHPGLGSRAAA